MIRDVKNGLTPDRRSSGLRSVSSLSLATLPVVFDQSTAARWPFTYNYDVRLFVDARIVEISVRCQQLAIPSSDSGTALLVVWQPCHTADMSTNRRQSFLCCRTTCMEQGADRPEAAAVDRLISQTTESIFV